MRPRAVDRSDRSNRDSTNGVKPTDDAADGKDRGGAADLMGDDADVTSFISLIRSFHGAHYPNTI